ncbi:DUF3140 domain-containing protein [Actinospica sp. MGRD01-02]|uniref:DUF3140 domain-containing protein n=1 Tax=Actinospica acidithermotolerans TaxID=2828514 RepID=A0A941E5P4_9ACTN|nr:DUF3140 domain-containing protein [Actinospica acidithermotolerans]MBR7825571.1 DUF3140 domain-containing protein [Actinospica acidithermotolerans]
MSHAIVSDELWQDFHAVVNMTSRELEDWLRTEDAHEATEPLPDQAGGHGRGHDVLRILGKRRTDLDRHDETVMREVVETVSAQRDEQYTTKPGDTVWRHRLMCLGHDPLKPVG